LGDPTAKCEYERFFEVARGSLMGPRAVTVATAPCLFCGRVGTVGQRIGGQLAPVRHQPGSGGPPPEVGQLQPTSVARAARLAWTVATPSQARSHPLPIRNRTVSASRPGLFATTMTATTTGPKPAAVNAEAAARCPARQASSLRNVDGRRIPAKRFLGNRSVAAMRPSPTTTTPPNPNRIAFNTSARLRQFTRARTTGPERSYGLGACRPQVPALGKLS